MDESYNLRRYWIAALVVPEDQARPLTHALDAVAAAAAAAYSGIATTAELHGHALFHGQDDWSPLSATPRARISVYRQAFDAIAAHDVQVFIRGVNIPRLKERYTWPDHPHAVVLQHLLERVDEYAEREGQYALVIADEVDDAAEYRRDLWRFQRSSTPGWRSRQITRIVDTMHFVPSHASRLVQGADLIAYLHRRISSGVDKDARAQRANARLWEAIQVRVRHNYCWRP